MSVLAANKQNDICNGGDMAALTAAVEQLKYDNRYNYSRQRCGASLVQRSIRLLTAAMEQTWYINRYGYSRQRWSKLTTTEG